MKLENIKNIQILALHSVEEPDWVDFYRSICRWYSEKFSTPLHYVENELTDEYVMKHFYEYQFGELHNDSNEDAKKKYEELRDRILYEKEVKAKEEDDEEWVDEMNDLIKEEQKTLVKTQDSDENPNLLEEEFNISVPGEDIPPEF